MTSLVDRARRGVQRRWLNWQNNRLIREIALKVQRHAPYAPHTRPAATGQPIILFNASTRLGGLSLNAAYSMLAGWSLRLAGIPVVHLVCKRGLSRCVLGTNRLNPLDHPPCAECVAQSNAVYAHSQTHWFGYQEDANLASALSRLDTNELCAFEYHGLPLGEIILPSLRWVLRRHHLVTEGNPGKHYPGDEPACFLARQYIQSAWRVGLEFKSLLAETHPRALVVFNGTFYPEAMARYLAMQSGVPVITHEVGLQPFSSFFTTGEATAYPIDISPGFQLNPQQEQRLDAYLEQRFQGNFSMAGIRFWPEMRSLSTEFWRKASSFKQIVPVFTNVIFDTSQGHANVVFEHMFRWLDLVLEVIRAHPETYFVIRAHPDECRPGKESRESVAQWASRSQVASLPNVLFVDAHEYFSSYELIQRSKFVMVYNSTIGLEATLLGTPVLCGGKARFTQLPTVFFPSSPEEYHRMAEQFLAADKIDVPAEFRQNGRRFLFFQLFRTSLPFGDFLQEDAIYRGYVALRPFDWQALLPENSLTMKLIVDGIVNGKPFLLPE